MAEKIFILDGTAMLYRSFYGLTPLKTRSGIPTQAVYGFFRAVRQLIESYDPKKIAITWDRGPSIRVKEYSEYKSQRLSPPDELLTQKKLIENIAEEMGLFQIGMDGFEADDLIATIALASKKNEVVIVTSDKDLFQLISENVKVWDPAKREMIDEDQFFEKFGFGPEKLRFYHSILGDASDNIPGVKGIGKKGANELAIKFSSLDDLYENLEKVEKPRTKKLLEESRDNAFLSFKLFGLREAPINVGDLDMVFEKSGWSRANKMFQELEMSSLVNLFVDKKDPSSLGLDAAKEEVAQFSSEMITDLNDLKKLAKKVTDAGFCAVDTETTGLDQCTNRIVGISIAFDTSKGYYIPFGHNRPGAKIVEAQASLFSVPEKEPEKHRSATLSSDDVVSVLGPLFKNVDVKKIMHNAKFDLHFLRTIGLEVAGPLIDTMLAAVLVRSEWQKKSLKALSQDLLGERMETFKETIGELKHFGELDPEKATPYAANDALQTVKIWEKLKKELEKDKKLEHIFYSLEMPLCKILFQMESTGIKLDCEVVEKIRKKVEADLETISKKIEGSVKEASSKIEWPINLSSPRQVEALLYDALKLPVIKKKTSLGKRSTDRAVLDELAKIHHIPGLIIKHRELSKLESTYLLPLPQFVCKKTDRIHTTYSQSRVATGRLSSFDPNLQNIPVVGEKYNIREAFVAESGKRLMAADYSQIELRILAHISGDNNLSEAYLNNLDIHKKTASNIYNVKIDDVTHEQRAVGKRINFSVLYGLTPYSLSRELEISPSDAKKYIDAFFQSYPAVTPWMEKVIEEAKASGFVRTIMGRKRFVQGLNDRNKNISQAAERVAINYGPQGIASEIIKMAMIKIDELFTEKGLEAKILLQVHDELVIEFKSDQEKLVTDVVRSAMEGVVQWSVPLTVSIGVADSWGMVEK
jgi:DNA polymerase I